MHKEEAMAGATHSIFGRTSMDIIPNEQAVAQLKTSASKGNLIAVIGTGVSMALTDGENPALSWRGLIQHGFTYGVTKAKITKRQNVFWRNQINSKDLDDLLAAAEFVGRKLEAPDGAVYARWLEQVFENVEPLDNEMANAVRALHSAAIPLCTLNYDHLLERITGLPSVTLKDTRSVNRWISGERPSVLHLHGSWETPSTCILGIRDYETTLGDDVRVLIQRALASFHHLLFVGCGDTFADPNFSALIRWSREKMKAAAPQHYALVPQDQLSDRNADRAWLSFVDPISYGTDHCDLPGFLLKHFGRDSMTKEGSLTRLVPLDCEQENVLRSANSDTKSIISFKNSRSYPVKLYWIDSDGDRIFLHETIEPGETKSQRSFLTHVFVVTDTNERCLGIYTPVNERCIAVI
jgi:hypothetical protein